MRLRLVADPGVPLAPPGTLPVGDHAPAAGARCVSCGADVAGAFCASCGERRPEARHYTLRGFAEEAFESLTDVDGRLLRSIRTLFNQPGDLTVRYMRGERVNWVPPFRLFLLVNVVFFFLAGVFDMKMLDTPLGVQFDSQVYSGLIRPVIVDRLAERGIPLRTYALAFDTMTATLARSLVVLLVPGLAMLAALVNNRQRRPLLHHVAYAFYGMAAILGLVIGILGAVYMAAGLSVLISRHGFTFHDRHFGLVALAVVTAYFAAAQRRAYGDGLGVAVAKGLGLAFGVGVLLQLYRFVLFFVTFWTT